MTDTDHSAPAAPATITISVDATAAAALARLLPAASVQDGEATIAADYAERLAGLIGADGRLTEAGAAEWDRASNRHAMSIEEVEILAALLPAAPGRAAMEWDGATAWIAPEARERFAQVWKGGKLTKDAKDAALAPRRRAAMAEALTLIGSLSAPIIAAYTPAERDSWPTQAAEARAVTAGGGAADAPLLAMLAQARGLTLPALADVVLAQAAQFMAIAAAEQKLRRQAEAAIAAAGTQKDLDAALAAVTAAVDAARLQMAAS